MRGQGRWPPEHSGQNLGVGHVYQKEGKRDDQLCGHQCIVLEDSGVHTHGAQQTGDITAAVDTGGLLKGKQMPGW